MLKQYYYSSSSSSMNSVMSSSSATWEEKAFAEDAAGALGGGGCIWPPRSYSCSFCMREFRSAQALGGHMNVHRRDRARLKQCPHNTITTPKLPTDHHVPHHLRNNHSHGLLASTCPFSDPRAFISPYSSSSNSCSTAAASWSYLKPADLSEKNIMVIRSSSEEEDHQSIISLMGGDQVGDYVETDLTVGLINTVVRGNRHLAGGSCGEDASSCKRPKIASVMNSAPFPFFLQPAEVSGRMAAANSMEDLDLELRLGDPTPKVK